MQQTTVESFETHPDRYKHWRLSFEGDIARLVMDVQEDGGLVPGYELKLNSYDLGVDLELNDAVQRVRFEHPEVRCVVVTSGKDRIFCAGANIFMLGASTHAFKVNFCKYTNETRLSLEDASAHSNVKYLAACNGTSSGGGYELAIACDEILLVDDRSSAVSLPEVPLLGVLPGTGGLTRVTDKRKVRRDIADYFCTLAEGVRGKRAVDWRLIDATYKLSQFDEKVREHARKLADSQVALDGLDAQGVTLRPLQVDVAPDGSRAYRYVSLKLDAESRRAELTLRAPAEVGPTTREAVRAAGSDWWPLAAFREFDDALLHLRLNQLSIGTVVLRTQGDAQVVLAIDAVLEALAADRFVHEVRHFVKRTLKRLDYTAKTLIALGEKGSVFCGTLLELALAADRFFLLDDADEHVAVTVDALNFGAFPMGNGLTRLETRFLGTPERVGALKARLGEALPTREAAELELATFTPDEIDWDDEVRVCLEERKSLSPDGLTGMEANLRFAGPETLETKIFGRLTAWQNWIFQRPNAVGEYGALKSFGKPTSAKFQWERT
ncbi:MAG: 2,3-epoxybenzoyl-CoA dihydrolase [Bradymonadia bacterium]|jgi:benzoyl-CoA-dihydrodiol lyase